MRWLVETFRSKLVPPRYPHAIYFHKLSHRPVLQRIHRLPDGQEHNIDVQGPPEENSDDPVDVADERKEKKDKRVHFPADLDSDPNSEGRSK